MKLTVTCPAATLGAYLETCVVPQIADGFTAGHYDSNTYWSLVHWCPIEGGV